MFSEMIGASGGGGSITPIDTAKGAWNTTGASSGTINFGKNFSKALIFLDSYSQIPTCNVGTLITSYSYNNVEWSSVYEYDGTSISSIVAGGQSEVQAIALIYA